MKTYLPDYRYRAGSTGESYEANLPRFEAIPYVDVDQTLASGAAFPHRVGLCYSALFGGHGFPSRACYAGALIYYLSRLAEILPSDPERSPVRYLQGQVSGSARASLLLSRAEDRVSGSGDLKSFAPEQKLIDDFTEILFSCKLEPISAVQEEYLRRIGVLKRAQFLAPFLQQHPGIQHKAGVTLGGTFVVVYHKPPTPPLRSAIRPVATAAAFAEAFTASTAPPPIAAPLAERAATVAPAASALSEKVGIAQLFDAVAGSDVNTLAFTEALGRVSANQTLTENPDIRLLVGTLTGTVPIIRQVGARPGDAAARIITTTVDGLDDGTVIADFFLPYRIACDGPGMEFVLPKSSPSVTLVPACTSTDGIASVTVKVKGGVAPYEVAVDNGGYTSLGNTVALAAGSHTLVVRDDEGAESTPRAITIPAPIVIGAPTLTCQDGKFTATFTITGGTAPYTVNGQAAAGSNFKTEPSASGTSVAVEVADSVGCTVKSSFTHECPTPCTLPCAGMALRRGYRMWLPDADPTNPYRSFDLIDVQFEIESASGQFVDLSVQVRPLVQAKGTELEVANLPQVVNRWLDQINKVIASEPALSGTGNTSWLTLAYQPEAPGRLGTLFIEHFECLRFSLKITFRIVRANGTATLIVAYTPEEGTFIREGETTVRIPPFDGALDQQVRPRDAAAGSLFRPV